MKGQITPINAETNAAPPTLRICCISVSMPAINIRIITPRFANESRVPLICTQPSNDGPTITPTNNCPSTAGICKRWQTHPANLAAISKHASNASNTVVDIDHSLPVLFLINSLHSKITTMLFRTVGLLIKEKRQPALNKGKKCVIVSQEEAVYQH